MKYHVHPTMFKVCQMYLKVCPMKFKVSPIKFQVHPVKFQVWPVKFKYVLWSSEYVQWSSNYIPCFSKSGMVFQIFIIDFFLCRWQPHSLYGLPANAWTVWMNFVSYLYRYTVTSSSTKEEPTSVLMGLWQEELPKGGEEVAILAQFIDCMVMFGALKVQGFSSMVLNWLFYSESNIKFINWFGYFLLSW